MKNIIIFLAVVLLFSKPAFSEIYYYKSVKMNDKAGLMIDSDSKKMALIAIINGKKIAMLRGDLVHMKKVSEVKGGRKGLSPDVGKITEYISIMMKTSKGSIHKYKASLDMQTIAGADKKFTRIED